MLDPEALSCYHPPMDNFASSHSYETFKQSTFAAGQARDYIEVESPLTGCFADHEDSNGNFWTPYIPDGDFALGQRTGRYVV